MENTLNYMIFLTMHDKIVISFECIDRIGRDKDFNARCVDILGDFNAR